MKNMIGKNLFLLILILLIANFCILFTISAQNQGTQDSITGASSKIPPYLKVTHEGREQNEPVIKEETVLNEKKEDKKTSNIKTETEKTEKKEEMTFDSTTAATDSIPVDEITYYEQKKSEKKYVRETKETKKEEKIDEKKAEEKKVKEEKKEEKVVKKEESSQYDKDKLVAERETYDPDSKKTSMILFKKEKDKIPPWSLDDFTESESSKKNYWLQSDDFIPHTLNDFLEARPRLTYNNRQIIQPGKTRISHELGEEAFALSYHYYHDQDFHNAIQNFTKLIHYHYRIPEASYYMGWCYYLLKDYEMAIRYMDHAIGQGEIKNIKPSVLADYYYQMGYFYFDQKKYTQSIENFQESLIKDPAYLKNYEKLGLAFYHSGNYQNALDIWKKGSDLNNKKCSEYYNWLKDEMGITD